jgi:hypothetical protein
VRSGIKTALALAARLVAGGGGVDAMLACGLEVPARGAAALLGITPRESVSVFVVDRALAERVLVPVTRTLDLPRGPLLANEEALALARELGLVGHS